MLGQQVQALAMLMTENCKAPEDRANEGEFWCTAGPVRDGENQALASSLVPFEVWVSPPGPNSNYQLRGRF